jgi:hypothetical protein
LSRAALAQDARLGAAADEVTMTTELGAVPDGRSYTLRTYKDPKGKVLISAYEVEGMAHSWSGGAPAGAAGDAAGPLTDPLGPDATRLMWAFFQDHPMPAKRRQAVRARSSNAMSARRRKGVVRPARGTAKVRAATRVNSEPWHGGSDTAELDRIDPLHHRHRCRPGDQLEAHRVWRCCSVQCPQRAPAVSQPLAKDPAHADVLCTGTPQASNPGADRDSQNRENSPRPQAA